MTVFNTSRTMGQSFIGGASTVAQAAQTYQYTAQAAKDTGATPGVSKAAGAKEAFATVMTGSQPGGPRAAGERIYTDNPRSQQFADVRNSSANSVSAPSQTGNAGNVTIAASKAATNAASPASVARDSYEPKDTGASDSWGVFASDRATPKSERKR
jgi:hypothetical protein